MGTALATKDQKQENPWASKAVTPPAPPSITAPPPAGPAVAGTGTAPAEAAKLFDGLYGVDKNDQLATLKVSANAWLVGYEAGCKPANLEVDRDAVKEAATDYFFKHEYLKLLSPEVAGQQGNLLGAGEGVH